MTFTFSHTSPRTPSRWSPWFAGVARGLAFFLGAFSLLNILGDLRTPGFDANLWWIDFRPLPEMAARAVLFIAAIVLLDIAVRPVAGRIGRGLRFGILVILHMLTGLNIQRFLALLNDGVITTRAPLPLSLFIYLAVVIVLVSLIRSSVADRTHAPLASIIGTILVCLVLFPLAQLYCFGLTDYRRPADAIVVLGARVYADGQMSMALQNRVDTGIALYQEKYAPRLVFSGGPGDGAVHETEAMRDAALRAGVPAAAITLDTNGLDTRATVRNTVPIFQRIGARRVIAVSHFWHLPRIKLTYQRAGMDVYTVPADEGDYPLINTPQYMAREVVALWAYYLSPLWGR